MAVVYALETDSNSYKIINFAPNTIYVTLYSQDTCESMDDWTILVPEQPILSNEILVLEIPKDDGIYQLEFTDKLGNFQQRILYNYRNLFLSLIDDIKYVLCGCVCEQCPECKKQEKDYLSVFIKLLSYNILTDSPYNEYLLITNSCIRCAIDESNNCALRAETILGNSDNTFLMKQLIAYYYLVYYYSDLKINENLEYITEAYQYKDIIKCIRNLGIDERCIDDNINPPS